MVGDRARFWGVRAEERALALPCDALAPGPRSETLMRGVTVAAPPATVFRWVCQIKVAPYSYDLIDNRGRRSPRTLTPGAGELAVGQDFQIGRIASFSAGRHITVVTHRAAERLFGPIALTYMTLPDAAGGTRLLVRLHVGVAGRLGAARFAALAWGDLIMMRKQLLTLKALAERSAAIPAG